MPTMTTSPSASTSTSARALAHGRDSPVRVASSRELAARDAASRRLVLPVLVQDAFRVMAGALLLNHYLEQLRFTAPALGLDGVWHPPTPSSVSAYGSLARALSVADASHVRAWFALACTSSIFIAIGLAPRLCAALLVGISAVTYRAIAPAVTPDDFFAQALSIWLFLSPVGKSLVVTGARDWRRWTTAYVNGWPFLVFILFCHLVLLNLCFHGAMVASAAYLVVFLSVAWAAAPVGAWRALAALPVAVGFWHVARCDGVLLVSRTCLGACVLFILGVALRGAPRSRPEHVATFDWPSAVGAGLTTLLGLHFLALPRTAGHALARATGAVLTTSGLAPDWIAPAVWKSEARLDVLFALDDGRSARAEGLDVGNPRIQVILETLALAERSTDPARDAFVRDLVAEHCRRAQTDVAPSAGSVLLLRSGGGRPLRVASFQCQDAQEARVALEQKHPTRQDWRMSHEDK